MSTHTECSCTFTKLALLAAASIIAYVLLYEYAGTVIAISEKVQHGEKALALVPIAIAFAFSIVHGNFTSHFWDYLGFKPKKK